MTKHALIGALAVAAMLTAAPHAGAAAKKDPPHCLTWQRSSPTEAYDGGRTAGYSWAWNKVVGRGGPGGSTTRVNRVKEIQCLLDYRGLNSFLSAPTPPPIDPWQPWGYYGSETAHNVAQAQSICRIRIDGVVGAKTWRCLRRDGNW
jgi:hypothetical protein